MAYLAVLFVLFGTIPLAFTAANFSFNAKGAAQGAPGVFGWQTVLLVFPLLVAIFIRRWATIVDERGITIRAAFGKRLLPWQQVRGLTIRNRTVYAVTADGQWRLPCVHVGDLGVLSRASAGHVPEIADPRPRFPPQRRRRR
jgi:hypothetical protein